MKIKNIGLTLFVTFLLMFNADIINAAEPTENLESIIMEDFELGQDGKPVRYWAVVPDKLGREGNSESGKSLQDIRWVKSWPEAYFGAEIPGKNRGEYFYGAVETEEAKKRYTDYSSTCLGLKLAFNRQGYNHVDIVPLESVNGKFQPALIPFRGKVRQVDLWVWGANYNYTMELVVMDYKGNEYRLDIGSIRHIGWKNFIIPIPNYIQQSTTYISKTQTLRLVKLVIWTTPTEKVTGAYVYIDQIKYLTDVYNSIYDGYQLGNPDTVQSLWDKGATAPADTDIKQ